MQRQQQQQQLQQQQQMERLRVTNIMNQGMCSLLINKIFSLNFCIKIFLKLTEMHAIWPFGPSTFISPALLPAHNIGLPIATLPTYAAVPIYQSALQQCANLSPISSTTSGTSSSSGSNLHAMRTPNMTGNAQQISSNDSNKINIQIGLQCVAQNAPINYNSVSDGKLLLNAIENACEPSTAETSGKG